MKINVTLDVDQELLDTALAYLRHDDAYPEVGMGMFSFTALNYAVIAFNRKYGTAYTADQFPHVLQRIQDRRKE